MNKNSLILPFSAELITPSFALEGSMSIPPAEHFLCLWTAFGPIELSAQLLAASPEPVQLLNQAGTQQLLTGSNT